MTSTSHKVLVVEDEVPLATAISTKLEKRGFATIVTGTAKDAMKAVTENDDIDVIWLDHYLPGGGWGLDVVVGVRSSDDERIKRIPIFVVSNTAGSDKIYQYMQLSIDKFFVKANSRLDQIIGDIDHLLASE